MKILSDKSSTAPEDTNSKPLIQLFTPSFAGLVEEKDYTAIAAKCLIPQGLDIPKPETVFDIEGIPVFTKKSLSTIIAKAKAGKTTVTAWIIAQVIKKGLTVLWLDTEQGLYYGSRTQFWILSIAGTPESGFLKFYDLKIYNPTDRIQIIETLISEIRPDIVVIDGIRDLVFDINSPEEATNSTGDLMRWAESNNCHIINILHQNKGNEHARGHLGSEMINKSESVLKVTQNEDKQIVLEPEFTRGLAFNAIAFERDGNGIPHLIENWKPENVTANGVKRVTPPYDVDPSTHKDIIRDTFNVNPEMIRNELEVSAKANISRWLSREIGIGKVREWIQHWEQFGHIKKTGTPGTRSAKYSINKTELN